MVAVPAEHDFSAKTLLEGSVDAAGKPMAADLAFAMQNITQHPNVGPFIGKQLIQKLVTGNPSPQYVARVSAVFDNDGSGVKGNLQAVISAILSDPEARGDVKTDPGYGKLREPVLFLTAAARALGTALGRRLLHAAGQRSQRGRLRRGFGLQLLPAGLRRARHEPAWPGIRTAEREHRDQPLQLRQHLRLWHDRPLATLPGATGTQPNWSALQSLAASPNSLVSELNNLLMHGSMPAAMQTTLLSAVALVPASDPLTRAKTAFYLTITSPEYQVER